MLKLVQEVPDSPLWCLGALRDRHHSPGFCCPAPCLSRLRHCSGRSLQAPEFLASLRSSSDPCWLSKNGMCLLGIGSGWSQRPFKQLDADKVYFVALNTKQLGMCCVFRYSQNMPLWITKVLRCMNYSKLFSE